MLKWNAFFGALALAVVGGAIGAGLVAVLTKVGMATSIAILIALVPWLLTTAGWFASARLSEAAQRRLFRHNIVNDARGQIVRAIRAQSDWAGSLGVFGLTTLSAWERFMSGGPAASQIRAFARDTIDQLRNKLFIEEGTLADLVMTLEEYELLFPQTRNVRDQLSHYAMSQVSNFYMSSMPELHSGVPARIDARVRAMAAHLDVTSTYQAVLQDLLIWVQNAALSEITGQRVPARQPRDRLLARMIERADGQLEIVESGMPWPITPNPLDEPTPPAAVRG